MCMMHGKLVKTFLLHHEATMNLFYQGVWIYLNSSLFHKCYGTEFVVMKIWLRLTHHFWDAFSIFKMFLPRKLPHNQTPCIKIHSYLYGACSNFACTNTFFKKFITNSDVTGTQSSYKMWPDVVLFSICDFKCIPTSFCVARSCFRPVSLLMPFG